ncbi:hypothetical protein RZS28_04425 [Methylocapsa polymorpha]|uniref:Uncharacterized protein n=1 Tax=Methylocapsa polymorpha TaxID=3080828 RepID=A0ABZ0HVG9_9HYPH|nr:hypothetical protein RZS28_04425 [Methylocapsa sp. RX1]
MGAAYEGVRLPLSRASQSRRLLWRLGMGCLAASGFASVLAFLSAAQDPALRDMGLATPPPPPLPAWIEISHAAQVFGLEAPELAKETKSYEARRHRTGGGRQDVLTFGGVNGDAPRLRLTIYRVGEEATPDAAFFVDLARRAAEMGRAITRATQPTALPTRLGVFEAASLNLAQNDESDSACIGFRMINAAPKLRITGFACGGANPAAIVASKSELACLIDRIDLAAAYDSQLMAFFAARDLSDDTACAGPRPGASLARSTRLEAPYEAASPKGQRKTR